MGSNAEKDLAFAKVHAYQAEIEHLQITQPAVYEACRAGRRSRSEIVLFEKRNLQAAQSCVTCNAGADDAATDNNHVESGKVEFAEPAHRFRRGTNRGGLLGGIRGISRLRQRRLPDLFEVLLYVMLVDERDLIPVNLPAGLGMRGVTA